MSDIKNILIVGNGHSCREIDYRRLPETFKVMRFNEFFREENYFAGRKVDYCLCYYRELEDLYYKWRMMNMSGEYEIDMINGIYTTVLFESDNHFPSVKLATLLIQQNIAIAEFRCFYEYYHEQYLPTGVQGIALAAVLCFDNVFLAGFDFGLNTTSLHPWDEGKSNEEEHSHFLKRHPLDIQIKFLDLLKLQFQQTNFYSVCENSPINQYIEKAPIIRDGIIINIKSKNDNNITEIIVPERIKDKNRFFF